MKEMHLYSLYPGTRPILLFEYDGGRV